MTYMVKKSATDVAASLFFSFDEKNEANLDEDNILIFD